MKKVIIILVSFLLLLNSFGYVFVYFLVRQNLKSESIENLRSYTGDEELIVITIAKNSLNSTGNDYDMIDENEIKYKGKMYDIYKQVENENNINLYCVCDEKEDNLNKAFYLCIKELTSNNTSRPALRNIVMNKISIGIIPETDNIFTGLINKLNFYLNQFLITNYIEVIKPPPKYITAI
jgi:hypothetical protein